MDVYMNKPSLPTAPKEPKHPEEFEYIRFQKLQIFPAYEPITLEIIEKIRRWSGDTTQRAMPFSAESTMQTMRIRQQNRWAAPTRGGPLPALN